MAGNALGRWRRGGKPRSCAMRCLALPVRPEWFSAPRGRVRARPMRCPFCGQDDTAVKDSRPTEDGA
ncbi:MAG: hypothetical protein ACREH9_14115, partial [Pseudomonadota bacterium]